MEGDDGRPYDIRVGWTTYSRAQAILGGSSKPSPPPMESVYLMAMHGRSNGLIGFMPRREAIRVVTPQLIDRVLEILVSAKPLQMIESSMLNRYPAIKNAVRIG
jgi:hypothetical protein